MNQLHEMKVFVAVAEEQGFAAGARRLRMSPPAVTRAISALEQRLGVKLLDRTTRYVRSTETGIRYLEDARRILSEIEAADEAATGINAEPRGHLAVTAPVLFGREYVMPGIVEYLKHYPETDVSALFLDRVVNFLEEGLDVGVRIGELPDSSMRALRVGSVRLVLCASPNYLDQYGLPLNPDDLASHTLIASHAGSGSYDWRFDSESGPRPLRINPRLTVTSNDAAVEAALEDLGITRLISYQVASQVAEGGLKIILEDYELAPQPIHILHREGRFATARVRAFVDLLADRLRDDKTLN